MFCPLEFELFNNTLWRHIPLFGSRLNLSDCYRGELAILSFKALKKNITLILTIW